MELVELRDQTRAIGDGVPIRPVKPFVFNKDLSTVYPGDGMVMPTALVSSGY